MIETLTMETVAQKLGMTTHTLMRKAKKGIIPGCKPGRHWIFLKNDIEEWLHNEANKIKYHADKIQLHIEEATKTCQSKDAKVANFTTLTSHITAKELENLLTRPTKPKPKNMKTS